MPGIKTLGDLFDNHHCVGAWCPHCAGFRPLDLGKLIAVSAATGAMSADAGRSCAGSAALGFRSPSPEISAGRLNGKQAGQARARHNGKEQLSLGCGERSSHEGLPQNTCPRGALAARVFLVVAGDQRGPAERERTPQRHHE